MITFNWFDTLLPNQPLLLPRLISHGHHDVYAILRSNWNSTRTQHLVAHCMSILFLLRNVHGRHPGQSFTPAGCVLSPCRLCMGVGKCIDFSGREWCHHMFATWLTSRGLIAICIWLAIIAIVEISIYPIGATYVTSNKGIYSSMGVRKGMQNVDMKL